MWAVLCLKKVLLWSDSGAPWHDVNVVPGFYSHARQGTAVVFDRPTLFELLEVIEFNSFIVIIK